MSWNRVLNNPRERFVATTGRARGNKSWIGATPQAAMALADREVPSSSEYISVRGEYTSDGTNWGLGRGRMVAVRERGKWTRF